MAESLLIDSTLSKENKYKLLLEQLKNLVSRNDNLVSTFANVSSALHYTFNFLWTGFYLVEQNKLTLGPFQGPIACTEIYFGKGVCGKCFEKEETILVGNVDEFDGHIACSSNSKSEIVVPIFNDKKTIIAVLDIDSEIENNFCDIDKKYLEALSKILQNVL